MLIKKFKKKKKIGKMVFMTLKSVWGPWINLLHNGFGALDARWLFCILYVCTEATTLGKYVFSFYLLLILFGYFYWHYLHY